MNVGYIYKADLYCKDCGEKIKESLANNPEFKDMKGLNDVLYDSDDYPKESIIGESDSPDHCYNCEIPLDNTLTTDGINYVLDAIGSKLTEILQGKIVDFNELHDCRKEYCYYSGSRQIEILRDWAEQLSNYGLNSLQDEIITFFMELTTDWSK